MIGATTTASSGSRSNEMVIFVAWSYTVKGPSGMLGSPIYSATYNNNVTTIPLILFRADLLSFKNLFNLLNNVKQVQTFAFK